MVVTAEVKLGRPKKYKPGEPVPGRKKVSVTANDDWADWAEEGARHCRMTLSAAIDNALLAYYQSRGFDKPPPPRY